jgi:hypothetical protein
MDILDSHPAVLGYGELFLPDKEGRPPFGAQDQPYFSSYLAERGTIPRLRLASVRAGYLDAVYAPRDDVEAIGFKLMYAQARLQPGLVAYFVRRRVRIVHLVRRNTLDIVLSSAAAEKRNTYHARAGDTVEETTIELDPSRLVADLTDKERKTRWVRAILSRLGVPYLEVFYEDLAADPESYAGLFRFLAVDPSGHVLRSPLKKLNRAPREQLIANYELVERALAGTRFAALLREHTAAAES